MAATLIGDIFVPSVFTKYLNEAIIKTSNLIKSGIMATDARLSAMMTNGGSVYNIPFFKNLSGADQVMSATAALSKTGTSADIMKAIKLARGQGFSVDELAKNQSGEDIIGNIAMSLASYWNEKIEDIVINSLTGVFADNAVSDSSDLIESVYSDVATPAASNKMTGDAIVDALAKLGDHSAKLTGIIMHSLQYANLRKLQLVNALDPAAANIGFGTYLGKTIIVDDTVPVIAGTNSDEYTAYLFTQGAIAYAENGSNDKYEADAKAGDESIYSRRYMLVHPKGFDFISGSMAGITPTNAELALAANWDRVYDKKNSGVVALKTNV